MAKFTILAALFISIGFCAAQVSQVYNQLCASTFHCDTNLNISVAAADIAINNAQYTVDAATEAALNAKNTLDAAQTVLDEAIINKADLLSYQHASNKVSDEASEACNAACLQTGPTGSCVEGSCNCDSV